MRGVATLVVLGMCGGLVGCGSDARPVALVASSLRPALDGAGPPVRLSFMSSGAAATQIRLGIDVDVIVSADPAITDDLRATGAIDAPLVIARNRLAVMVPAGNPKGLLAIGDLALPGVRVAVGGSGVPLGDYTRQALDRAGKLDLRANIVTEEPDAAGVVAKLSLGVVDAAIGYGTDLLANGIDGFILPADLQPDIRYSAAIVAGTKRRADAEAYVAWLTGPEGRRALDEAGFLAP